MMFQLTVIDADHMILTTEERLPAEIVHMVRDAFEGWKEKGGALVIAECLVVDRHAITVDIDIDVVELPETFDSPGDSAEQARTVAAESSWIGAELNGGDGP